MQRVKKSRGFKLILFFISIFCLFYSLSPTHAQKSDEYDFPNNDSASRVQKQHQDSIKDARQHTADSTRDAQKKFQDSVKTVRTHTLDSTKAAREHIMDSTKTARGHILDSTKTVRKHFADSLAAVHKYRDSKHYKDSVSNARLAKTNALKKQRQDAMDALKAARKKTTDSVTAIRKAKMDIVHAIQKKRSDSLAVIRKYRESKRFRDSVSVVRHERADSMQDARDAFNKKMMAIRKKHQDSVVAVRKHVLDSTIAVRTKHLDSVKAIRKVRTDSLNKIKVARKKAEEAKQKAREKKMQLALDLKIKQKHEKWSNQSMLKKKWSATRQVEQNTVSRFNYYYNANLKMDEALANMQRARKENYDSIIGLYPFDPNKDSSLLLADMDTIIRKTSVGIQIHDPRIKWGDDLYLLMGEAYYYKGGYDNAAITFHYIISSDERNKKKKSTNTTDRKAGTTPSIAEDDKKKGIDFLKHKSVHNDAILWLSRTYTEAHQLENAEAILSLLDADPNLPKDLQGQIAIAKAFVMLNDHNPADASKQLTIGMQDDHVPSWLRQRAAFLNGQLQQQQGNYAAAVTDFKQVLDDYPKLEMEFYSRKYLAYNTLYAGGKEADAMAPLKKILNDAKYASYYDQVYFILGELAVKSGNTAGAVTYLQQSISTPKASKKQKASSFAALGNVYYGTGNYVAAKNAYDSAGHYAGAASSKDTLIGIAIARSRVLGKATGPAGIIHDEDSLLHLASLDEKGQRAAVHAYIKELEKRRADSIFRAENADILAVSAATLSSSSEGESDYSNWYFSNPNQMQQGFNDFKRKWGNRTLTDNWRRSSSAGNGGVAGADNNENADSTGGASSADLDENGLPTEASLLAAIPNTPEQKERAVKLIQRAYIDLANAYVKDLEDYPKADNALDTLDTRYPDHPHKPEDLYLRYMSALRQVQLDKAKSFSSELIEKYPTSEYAKLVRPKDDSKVASANTVSVSAYYDQTYDLLMQRQYSDVLTRVDQAKKTYKDPNYNGRFSLVEVMALAGSGDYNHADTVLTAFLHSNPSDSLRDWADAITKYLNKMHPVSLPAPAVAKPAIPGAPATVGNKPVASPVTAPATYTYKPQDEHYCIISLPGIESRSMGVKAAITDFNTFKYSSLTLNIAMDPLSVGSAVVVIKKFPNAAQAKSYMAALKATSQIFREYKSTEYQVMIISSANYQKLLSDRSIQPYRNFYTASYK